MALDEKKVVWVTVPRSRLNSENAFQSIKTVLYSMYHTYIILLTLPDIESVVSVGAGIALSVFVPFFFFFVFLDFYD